MIVIAGLIVTSTPDGFLMCSKHLHGFCFNVKIFLKPKHFSHFWAVLVAGQRVMQQILTLL